MRVTPVTPSRLGWILISGFGLVILLLLASGLLGVRNTELIRQSAAGLVNEQVKTTLLLDEVQRERGTVNAVFLKLNQGPEAIERERIVTQLDDTDEAIDRIVTSAAGTPEHALWIELQAATDGFSEEARRLLDLKNPPSLLSRDLLLRHEQVLNLVSRLTATSSQRAQAAQTRIQQLSYSLVRQSAILLGLALLLASGCAILTVRWTTILFRQMEWQTGELSRVSWHMLQNQETIAKRFSHELHDELGQSLAAVKANLVALAQDPRQAEDGRLNDCHKLVDEAIGNVREMSQLLHPTVLDDFGLDVGLRSLTDGFRQRTGLEVDYSSGFQGRLPDEVELHLFRIAQEALTNIARHAHATRIQVRLDARDGRLRLNVRDNGRGLPVQASENQGLGLTGMRARAGEIGGQLHLQSEPSRGVTIEVSLPQPEPAMEANDTYFARR